MRMQEHEKVQARHLKRNAYLYVRQSTMRQVVENTESTQRQYGLRQRAVALGWPAEGVVVIDNDQGQSGKAAADREGFQCLVAEVGMGHAGLVMGLEVSRLARNSADWHRLLEICALSETLILDEDGLYDPNDFNDRLLLGLKGAMSEAELHLIRSRLRGGILSKAKRGELRTPLPVGLVYGEQGQAVLDPDRQVQESLRFLFRTFRRVGTARATAAAFRRQGLLFPRRLRKGPDKGKLLWAELHYSRVLQILHNPRYAGAFFFGRRRTRKKGDGHVLSRLQPPEQWHALLPGAHAGYISWQEYEGNQRQLRQTAQALGMDRRRSPAREGPALLQGLLMCGVCGQRMTVRCRQRGSRLVPHYLCQRKGIEKAGPVCQHIPGAGVDEAVGQLVVEAVTPLSLEVALAVQEELQSQLEEAGRLRLKQVERARYEADLARRRYMQVDPNNRLVADELEANWNGKLRALAQAQEDCERGRQADRAVLDERQREELQALLKDFPRLWHDPRTPQRDRKRMIRLLIENVTLIREKQITVQILFKGGATTTLTLPLPVKSWQSWQTPPEVVAEVDRLLEHCTEAEIACILNERGLRSGKGRPFNVKIVARLRREYRLKARYERLREKGLLTLGEMAQRLGVSTCTVKKWRDHGLVAANPYNGKKECLYDPPGPNPPTKMVGRKLSERRAALKAASNGSKEVQYEV